MTLVVGCFLRLDQLRVLDKLSALLVPVLMLLQPWKLQLNSCADGTYRLRWGGVCTPDNRHH